MKSIGSILGFIWALPITALGWLFCLIMWLFRQMNRPYMDDDLVILWPVRLTSWFYRALGNRAAFVFGLVVIYVIIDPRIMAHEKNHCLWIQRLGVFFTSGILSSTSYAGRSLKAIRMRI